MYFIFIFYSKIDTGDSHELDAKEYPYQSNSKAIRLDREQWQLEL